MKSRSWNYRTLSCTSRSYTKKGTSWSRRLSRRRKKDLSWVKGTREPTKRECRRWHNWVRSMSRTRLTRTCCKKLNRITSDWMILTGKYTEVWPKKTSIPKMKMTKSRWTSWKSSSESWTPVINSLTLFIVLVAWQCRFRGYGQCIDKPLWPEHAIKPDTVKRGES